MSSYKIPLTVSILTLGFALKAAELEYDCLMDICKHVKPDSVLVLDIENTLAQPYIVAIEEPPEVPIKDDVPMSEDEDSGPMLMPEKPEPIVKYSLRMKPVEETTPGLIKEMQNQGVTVIAITAEPCSGIDRMCESMRLMGIDLSRNPLTDRVIKGPCGVPYIYKDGIICAEYPKGDVLVHFLKCVKCNPGQVVFADNTEEHVRSVEEAMRERRPDVECICIRYTRCDESKYEKKPENMPESGDMPVDPS